MSAKRKALAELRRLPADLARVSASHDAAGNQLIICFDHDPANLPVQLALVRTALVLANSGLFQVMGTEAGFGDVDTSWIDSVGDDQTRHSLADALLESFRLSPAEYVRIMTKKQFLLFGAENQELYEQARRAFAGYAELRQQSTHDGVLLYAPGTNKHLDEFVRLLDVRAAAIVTNLSRRMTERRADVAALVCATPLMDRVCDHMRRTGPSYVRITPVIHGSKWQSEKYEELMKEQTGQSAGSS